MEGNAGMGFWVLVLALRLLLGFRMVVALVVTQVVMGMDMGMGDIVHLGMLEGLRVGRGIESFCGVCVNT